MEVSRHAAAHRRLGELATYSLPEGYGRFQESVAMLRWAIGVPENPVDKFRWIQNLLILFLRRP